MPKLADGIFLSKARYGISLYGKVRHASEDPTCKYMNNIQLIENRMLRRITGSKLSDQRRTADLLDETGLLSINQMTAQSILGETWKAMNGLSPSLEHLFTTTAQRMERSTRSAAAGVLVVPRASKTMSKSFAYQAAKLWNSAPEEIKAARSFNAAKRAIKAFAKSLPV